MKPTAPRTPSCRRRALARTAAVAPALLALAAAAGCADPLMRKSNLPEKIDFSGGGTPPPVASRAPETSPAEPPATVGTPRTPATPATPGAVASPTTRESTGGPVVGEGGATTRPAVAGEVSASTRSSDVDLAPVPASTRRPTSGPAATLPSLPGPPVRLPAGPGPTTAPG